MCQGLEIVGQQLGGQNSRSCVCNYCSASYCWNSSRDISQKEESKWLVEEEVWRCTKQIRNDTVE